MDQINNITNSIRSRYQKSDTSSGIMSNPLMAGFNANKQSMTEQMYIPTSETHQKLNDGTYVAKYDNYVVGADNAELNAQNQSTSDKWLNGVTKFLGKTATAIVGGTLGSANGIAEFIQTGSMDSIYDNNFNRYLDDLNVTMDNKLPNYYSQEEMNGSFFDNLGTSNFWANDVLSGISFTLGAIGSEILIGKGMGLLAKGAGMKNLATLPQKIDNVSKAKKAGSGIVKGMYKDGGISGMGASIGLGKTQELAKTARFLYTSSGYEAGVEALQFKKEQEEGFQDKFFQTNGRVPTEEETAKFFEDLSDASNALWSFNTVLTGSSKMSQIGSLMGIKTPTLISSKWVNSKVFGAGVDKVGKALNPTKAQKLARKGYGLLRSEVTEGFEEGMQAVGSGAAERWLTATYDPKYINNSLDVTDSFIQSLGHTFTTSEGLKEVLTGALVGGITGRVIGRLSGSTASKEFKTLDENAKKYEEYSQKQLPELLAYSGRIQQATEQQEKADEEGNLTKSDESRRAKIIAQLEYADSIGYSEENMEDTVTAINSIDNETLKKEMGLSEDEAIKYKEDLLAEYKSTSEEYNRNKTFAKYYIGENIHEADQIHSAVATVMTLGKGSYDFNQNILNEIKKELTGLTLGDEVLDLKSVLDKATTETQQNFNQATKELFQVQSEIKALESQQKELLRQKSTPDNDFAHKANVLALDIAGLQEKKAELHSKLNNLYQLADMENPYSEGGKSRVVSEQALNQLDSILNNLSDLPSKVGKTDIQRATKIEKLIEEYNRSNKDFKAYSDVSRQLTSGEFNADELSKKAFKNKKRSDLMVEFLETIGRGEDKKSEETPRSNTAKIIKNEPIQPNKFKSIVDNNPFLANKDIDKPTESEVEEYLNLITKKETEGINTEIDQQRLDELQDKLDSWQLLDSFTNEGISILDMVNMEAQNTETPAQVMPETMTLDEVGSLSEGETISKADGERYEEISQTYEGVQIRTTKDGTFLHSTDSDNVISSFTEGEVEPIKNGYRVKFEDGTETILEDVRPGVVKVTGWENLTNNTPIERIKYSYSKSSFGFVYLNGEMMKGTLEDTGEYNFKAVYDLKSGDTLTFRVDANNEFNETLAPGDVVDNVKIYIIDSKGNVVGDVKSNNNVKGTSDNFLKLRHIAAEVFNKGGGFLPIEVKVDHIYLGTPVFTLENGTPKEQPFNSEDVLDWGYYGPNGFELTNGLDNIRTSFISKLKRKVPIVVFKRGGHLVAFPVNLKTQSNLNKGNDLLQIFEQNKTLGKNVVDANNFLLKEGLKGSLYYRGVNDQNIFNEDGSYTQEIMSIVNSLNVLPAVPNLLGASKDSLNTLISSPINISSNPLVSPKIVMDLGSMREIRHTPTPASVQQENASKKVKEVIGKMEPTPKEKKVATIKKEVETFEIQRSNFLLSSEGKSVIINGFKGVLNKINEQRFEVVNGKNILEINIEDVLDFNLDIPTLPKHQITNLTEDSVTINGVSYNIVLDSLGNTVGLKPLSNNSQTITNERMLVAVDIERSKNVFNIVTQEEVKEALDNLDPVITGTLDTIWGLNMSETVDTALDKLYKNEELSEQESLQTGIWLSDVFDRISRLQNKNNTISTKETILEAYNTAEIIYELLYGTKQETKPNTRQVEVPVNSKEEIKSTKTEGTKQQVKVVKTKVKATKKVNEVAEEIVEKEIEQEEVKPLPKKLTPAVKKTISKPVEVAKELVKPLNIDSKVVKEKVVKSSVGGTFRDFRFDEGSTLDDFKALAEEGARVVGPRDFYTIIKGKLVSDSRNIREAIDFPVNPKGWIISLKVEELSEEDTTNIQNKPC